MQTDNANAGQDSTGRGIAEAKGLTQLLIAENTLKKQDEAACDSTSKGLAEGKELLQYNQFQTTLFRSQNEAGVGTHKQGHS